jgi:hypothetical protein
MKKISYGIAGFHLFWLFLIFIFGEGILFGHRYFDGIIRIFSGIEIIITIVSVILIIKNRKLGYVLLAISILSTVIIELGHLIHLWPCEYCNL